MTCLSIPDARPTTGSVSLFVDLDFGLDDRTTYPLQRRCCRRDTWRSEWRDGRAADSNSMRQEISAPGSGSAVPGVTIWRLRASHSAVLRLASPPVRQVGPAHVQG
jgi:hypothetical protein